MKHFYLHTKRIILLCIRYFYEDIVLIEKNKIAVPFYKILYLDLKNSFTCLKRKIYL